MTEEKTRYGAPTIYLSGAIDHVTEEEAAGWRDAATRKLEERGYRVLNPLKIEGREGMTDEQIILADLKMISKADALLVEMTRDDIPYVGTSMEIAYAWTLRFLPVVIWGKPKSIWARYHGPIAPTLDRAIDLVCAMVKRPTPQEN